jgi:hypothetical protein
MKEKDIWSQFHRLLIVFPMKDEQQFKAYRIALDQMLNKSNVKELSILVLLPETVQKDTLKSHRFMNYFSKKDINFWGKIKDPYVETVIAQPYDALIFMEVEDKKMVKLIASAHATWKIGVNTPFDEFFTIQMNTKASSPDELVNFAAKLLEKISTNG